MKGMYVKSGAWLEITTRTIKNHDLPVDFIGADVDLIDAL